MSREARDILQGLLQRRVADRLGFSFFLIFLFHLSHFLCKKIIKKGSGPTGIGELKETPFFAELDFDVVMELGYEAEFKPPTGFLPSICLISFSSFILLLPLQQFFILYNFHLSLYFSLSF